MMRMNTTLSQLPQPGPVTPEERAELADLHAQVLDDLESAQRGLGSLATSKAARQTDYDRAKSWMDSRMIQLRAAVRRREFRPDAAALESLRLGQERYDASRGAIAKAEKDFAEGERTYDAYNRRAAEILWARTLAALADSLPADQELRRTARAWVDWALRKIGATRPPLFSAARVIQRVVSAGAVPKPLITVPRPEPFRTAPYVPGGAPGPSPGMEPAATPPRAGGMIAPAPSPYAGAPVVPGGPWGIPGLTLPTQAAAALLPASSGTVSFMT